MTVFAMFFGLKKKKCRLNNYVVLIIYDGGFNCLKKKGESDDCFLFEELAMTVFAILLIFKKKSCSRRVFRYITLIQV